MPLFHVQDTDRPMWVRSKTWGEAVYLWKRFVAVENDIIPEDVEEPLGIQFLAADDEVIWDVE